MINGYYTVDQIYQVSTLKAQGAGVLSVYAYIDGKKQLIGYRLY